MSVTTSEALIEAYLETIQVIRIDILPPDQKSCPVCQDPYLSQPLVERPVRINSLHPNSTCRHLFGYRCIEMHIRAGEPWSVRCPICREDWFTVYDGGAAATVAPPPVVPRPAVPRQVAPLPPLRSAASRPAAPLLVDSDADDDEDDEVSDDEGSHGREFYSEELDDEDFEYDEEDFEGEDSDNEDTRQGVSRIGRLIRYLGFMDRMLGQLDRISRANPDDELARLLAGLEAELERQ